MFEIGPQELAHGHDVMIEAQYEINERVSGAVNSALQRASMLRSNTGMQIAHLGKETLRVAMEAVGGTQAGKLSGEMSVRDFWTSPGEAKKATEGRSNGVEHSPGKDIKLLADERHDGGAVASEHRLEDGVIGEPHIDTLSQECYGRRVGAGTDQGQKLGNRGGST